jgi:sterol 3beta-glucosyltransferase
MKSLFASLGTQGDIEPFLAQVGIFSDAGHKVICLFPEQFRDIVSQLGCEFFSFGKDFLEILETESVKSITDSV